MARLALAVLPFAVWAQQQPAVQVSPPTLSFDDANVAFSQSLTLTSGTASIPVEIVADGGNPGIPAPSWLTVTPRFAATPARVTVTVSRPASTGTFVGRVAIRSRTPSAEVNAALITVRLSRPAEPFSASPTYLSFDGAAGAVLNPQTILVRGVSCGAVRATVSEPWLTVAPDRPGAACQNLVVTPRTEGLPPGGRSARIRLESGSDRIDVAATLFLTQPGPSLRVVPEGLQFESREGEGSGISRAIAVLGEGGSLVWNARVIDPPGPEGDWLVLGERSGAASRGADGRIPVTVDPAGLKEGTYYALVEVASPGARNSPQLLPVAYRVLAPASNVSATPSPSGMLFTGPLNGGRSAAQALTVFTSNTAAVPFLVTAHTFDGADWLTLDAGARTTSTTAPGRVNVFATPGRLPVGTYRGEVNVYIQRPGSIDVRSVNVTLVVTPLPTAARAAGRPLEGCTTASLVPTHTGLVNNFQTRVAWPTPLAVRVVDNCGEAVTDARVLAEFSNGDPPLAMVNPGTGVYTTTWAPRTAAPTVTIRVTASRGPLTSTVELAGRLAEGGAPVVEPNGVVNNFDRRAGGPLAPGTLVEIFGRNLAGGILVADARDGRLPTTLGDVTVFAGAGRMPLYAVSPGQINAQLPVDLDPGQMNSLVVKAHDTLSVPVRIGIVPVQPGVAAFATGAAIAQDLQFRLITAENKARAGGFVFLYLVGMGAVSPPVASGAVAPASPLAQVTEAPVVTLGGRPVTVAFAGLTPGLVGLYQINAVLPTDIPAGEWPLVVRQGGVESSPVTIPVE